MVRELRSHCSHDRGSEWSALVSMTVLGSGALAGPQGVMVGDLGTRHWAILRRLPPSSSLHFI